MSLSYEECVGSNRARPALCSDDHAIGWLFCFLLRQCVSHLREYQRCQIHPLLITSLIYRTDFAPKVSGRSVTASAANVRFFSILIGFVLFVLFDYCERPGCRRNSNSVMPTFRCRVFRLHSVTEAPFGRNAANGLPHCGVRELQSARQLVKFVAYRNLLLTLRDLGRDILQGLGWARSQSMTRGANSDAELPL